MQIGGWILEPVPGNPSLTKTTYLVELDLKGSIPGFVVKKANTDQGYQVAKIRQAVEKYLKEH